MSAFCECSHASGDPSAKTVVGDDVSRTDHQAVSAVAKPAAGRYDVFDGSRGELNRASFTTGTTTFVFRYERGGAGPDHDRKLSRDDLACRAQSDAELTKQLNRGRPPSTTF
jgi:hypothetical protein